MIYSENTMNLVRDWLRFVVTPHFEKVVEESAVEYEKLYNTRLDVVAVSKETEDGLAN